MLQRQFVVGPDTQYPLNVTAKQYWLPEFEAHWDDEEALTFIMLHSTSFHKETWEPTIQHIFKSLPVSSTGPFVPGSASSFMKVKCAWVIECPNHGQSAVLNDAALQDLRYFRQFGCEKYAEAVHRFMISGPVLSPSFDFKTQKLVGIGHSLGGVAIVILQDLQPAFPFASLILVEPLLSPQGLEPLRPLQVRLVQNAYERRDVWPSREDAMDYLGTNKHIARWDRRVLVLYVRYGLRNHPGAQHEVAPYTGVCLACSREEEVTMYRDPTGPSRGLEVLSEICKYVPVSVIFGGEKRLDAALGTGCSCRS
ncbi:hypothetical protein EDC04DRAFT_458063 [Pisolithus marmoratus]|nr:hypothetical protein EDC04DRAFT_458063 [Pisolithus marmoratus]